MARKTSEAMGWRSFIRWMYFPQRRSSIKEVFVRMGRSSLRRFRDVVRRKCETLKCNKWLKNCWNNDYKRGRQQEYTGSYRWSSFVIASTNRALARNLFGYTSHHIIYASPEWWQDPVTHPAILPPQHSKCWPCQSTLQKCERETESQPSLLLVTVDMTTPNKYSQSPQRSSSLHSEDLWTAHFYL